MDGAMTEAPRNGAATAIPALESFASEARRPYMPIAIGGAAICLGLALAAAIARLPDLLVYALAALSLPAIGVGIAYSFTQDGERERSALAAYADLPLDDLLRATVSADLTEKTRVLIVRVLNDRHPGWQIDLEQADADWGDLRYARGVPGGCLKGCCGSSAKEA